ncbi:hypothetical protein P692DRAFT_20148650 [Suillus brevipes Sb2]|nr:hypothetical protein P692DRAFT_20148650 [Suillus brevipes Sb2]
MVFVCIFLSFKCGLAHDDADLSHRRQISFPVVRPNMSAVATILICCITSFIRGSSILSPLIQDVCTCSPWNASTRCSQWLVRKPDQMWCESRETTEYLWHIHPPNHRAGPSTSACHYFSFSHHRDHGRCAATGVTGHMHSGCRSSEPTSTSYRLPVFVHKR